MNSNNLILNRLFTPYVFKDLLKKRNNNIYGSIIKRYISDIESKDNGELISEIYEYLSTSYRNEYFYKNTLLNTLLLKKHSIRTTTALTQIPIGKSKADFILINGKAVVYEIKTELDKLDRLQTQIDNYYKAFNNVCVVTNEDNYENLLHVLKNRSVGIYLMTSQNKIIQKRQESEENSFLDYEILFKVLRKKEYENILNGIYGKLPKVGQVFYYEECFNLFSKIPLLYVYRKVLKELKKRNNIIIEEFKSVPYELKSLMYFSKFKYDDYLGLEDFLNQKYRGA